MKSKSKSKSAALKATTKSDTKKTEASGHRGRPSEHAGKKLYPVSKENHRRPGSHGHKSFAIFLKKPGTVYETGIAQGARAQDIRWDIDHGYLVVK